MSPALARLTGSTLLLISLEAAGAQPAGAGPQDAGEKYARQIAAEAKAVRPLVERPLATKFLEAVEKLPPPEARTVYRHRTTGRYVSDGAWQKESDDEKRMYRRSALPAARFYITKYGSPIAYARALEIAGEHVDTATNKRVLDIGYGTIGHLRLLALSGADVVGVDVDSFLLALYGRKSDQGALGPGRVSLVDGSWPGDAKARAAVGRDFDLIVSKNTLKRGYIHPERKADPRTVIKLGVDDETYVKALFESLKPGGVVLIYNLCPPPSPPDKPYKTWADGRCPFSRSVLEKVGFEVLAFDVNDDEAARAQGRALGWGKRMKLEKDLFGVYTLFRRPDTP